MRRFAPFLLLLLLLPVPLSTVAAAAWHTFQDRSMGFSVRYPAAWKAQAFNSPGNRQLLLSHQGAQTYSLNVTILPIRPGQTIQATKNAYLTYQRKRLGNPTYQSNRWSPATIGGRSALSTVVRPSTEGGVTLADGVYIVPWRAQLYQIEIVGYHKPTFARLSQFPVIYRQILGTWRFL